MYSFSNKDDGSYGIIKKHEEYLKSIFNSVVKELVKEDGIRQEEIPYCNSTRLLIDGRVYVGDLTKEEIMSKFGTLRSKIQSYFNPKEEKEYNNSS